MVSIYYYKPILILNKIISSQPSGISEDTKAGSMRIFDFQTTTWPKSRVNRTKKNILWFFSTLESSYYRL